MQDVVEETVFVVPHGVAAIAAMAHGPRNIEEVLPKLAGDVLVGGVSARELECDGQHVQRVHRHPRRAVRLLNVASGRKGRAAVEYADVVEAEEAALEDVHSFGVLSVDPPREIQHQLLEDALEEGAVSLAAPLLFDLV